MAEPTLVTGLAASPTLVMAALVAAIHVFFFSEEATVDPDKAWMLTREFEASDGPLVEQR